MTAKTTGYGINGPPIATLQVGQTVQIIWNGYSGVSRDRSGLWTRITAIHRKRVEVLDPWDNEFTLIIRPDQIARVTTEEAQS